MGVISRRGQMIERQLYRGGKRERVVNRARISAHIEADRSSSMHGNRAYRLRKKAIFPVIEQGKYKGSKGRSVRSVGRICERRPPSQTQIVTERPEYKKRNKSPDRAIFSRKGDLNGKRAEERLNLPD